MPPFISTRFCNAITAIQREIQSSENSPTSSSRLCLARSWRPINLVFNCWSMAARNPNPPSKALSCAYRLKAADRTAWRLRKMLRTADK